MPGPWSPRKKAAVAVLAIGGVVGGTLLALGVAKGTGPGAGAITLSVSPHSLPDTGGTVTATGSTKDVADGATVSLTVDGTVRASGTVSGGQFSVKVPIAANSEGRVVTDRLAASATDSQGQSVTSRDATVSVAAHTKSARAGGGALLGMQGAGVTQAANNEVLRRFFATQ
jgi:hypothetical protein